MASQYLTAMYFLSAFKISPYKYDVPVFDCTQKNCTCSASAFPYPSYPS